MQFSVSKLHNWQAQTSIYEKNRRVIITRFTDSISIFWRVIAQSTIDMGWHKVVILIYWALGGRKNAKHINERVRFTCEPLELCRRLYTLRFVIHRTSKRYLHNVRSALDSKSMIARLICLQAYSERSQTSKMELFAKIVNWGNPSIIFLSKLHLIYSTVLTY